MSILEQNSKLLARWFRHRPDAISLKLDSKGWAVISESPGKARLAGAPITHHKLMQVVADNDKQRFSIGSERLRGQVVQGHSVDELCNISVVLRTFNRRPRLPLAKGVAFAIRRFCCLTKARRCNR
ncbi:RNA 2'-phosphotransferase [Rugamonas sp.]|uniref:RNA 2'-phosphotransferase n=1 Tax=Rugamonas sp. TaxID=1926287 RepID=UPI00345BD72D